MDLLAVFGMGETAVGRATTAFGGRRSMRQVTEAMQSNWLAFASTGRPLPGWPRYTEPERATMIFDSPTRIEFDPHSERRKAWAGYESYHRRGDGNPGEPAMRAQ